MNRKLISARRAPSPFDFLSMDPFDQGAMMAEALLARRDGPGILLGVSKAMSLATPESAGFISAVQAKLVGDGD